MSNENVETNLTHLREEWWKEVMSILSQPFPPEQVNWKPQKTWNTKDWGDKDKRNHDKALVVAFIDARVVADRLDKVFTPGSWQVRHKQEGGQLLTGIGVFDPHLAQWIWKWDGGHVNGSNDSQGQVTKGTLSDGLKRAAVLWGIGRYLYFLPKTTIPYDPHRRKITQEPDLPEWAKPGGSGRP